MCTYLQVLLAVENDVLCLHLPVLNVHLVATQDNGDVVTHTHQVTVPVGDILVCHSGGHVKHDDGTLALDVVAISESSKLLLTCRVPHVEPDRSTVGVEDERVYFDPQSG